MQTLRPLATPVDVLIIDDDELFGAATLERLKAQPWRVAFHHGPFGTVNAIRAAQPRLLILDLNMPGLEGTRILELVKKRGELPEMKVLLLSSTELSELEQIAKKNGFDGALHKSVNRAELIAAILGLLGKPPQHSGSPDARMSGSPDARSSSPERRTRSGSPDSRNSEPKASPGSLRPPAPKPSNRPGPGPASTQLSSARKDPSDSS